MQEWSSRALDALRKAPVVSRGAAAEASPTRALDDELHELTGRRGLPVLDGVVVGYPSTLNSFAEAAETINPAYCLWGKGRTTIRLKPRSLGKWETSDLGGTLGWREVVELLLLEEQYRSWLPALVCRDASEKLPRRWSQDLALALHLSAVTEVTDAFADHEILCWSSYFLARTRPGFERILGACKTLGFSADMYTPAAEAAYVDDLEPQASTGPWTCWLRSGTAEEERLLVGREEAVGQIWRFRGRTVEVIDSSPDRCVRYRARPPVLGSQRLQEYLRQYALVIPGAPPQAAASTAMRNALAAVRDLGRLLLLRPHEGRLWLGLWEMAELPSHAERAAPEQMKVAPAEPCLTRVDWPAFRWGDLEMICIGGGPEFELYLCDATGAVWMCDAVYGHFDFVCGSPTSWLERIAFDAHLGALPGPLVTFPLGTPGELPAHFGVPLVPECSDPRAGLYLSDIFVIWESAPPRGRSLLELRARSADAIVEVLRWAKRRWGTQKVALGWEDAPPEVVDMMRAEGIQCIDRETSGWQSPEAWE